MGLDKSKTVGSSWGTNGLTVTRVVGPDGVLEDRYAYDHGDVIYQRDCDREDCEDGLLLAPARFCGRCNGCGYLIRVDRADTVPEGIPPMIRGELAEGHIIAGASRTAADEYFDDTPATPAPERATFANRVIGGLPDPNAAYPPAVLVDDGLVEFRDDADRFVFKIMKNGRVQLGPDVDLNEAAKQFWAAVAGWSPMLAMRDVPPRLDEMERANREAADQLDESAPGDRLNRAACLAYACAYAAAARMVREALQ